MAGDGYPDGERKGGGVSSHGWTVRTMEIGQHAIALVLTDMGMGPINLLQYSDSVQLLVLEAFLASAIFVGLPVSAILATRKRMMRELSERTAELSLLADNITDAVLRYDAEGICTYASPSTMQVLGRPPSDFIGRKASDRLHPDAREQVERVPGQISNQTSDRQISHGTGGNEASQ